MRRSRRRWRRRRNRFRIGFYPDKSLTVDCEVIGMRSFQTHHHFPDLLLDDFSACITHELGGGAVITSLQIEGTGSVG